MIKKSLPPRQRGIALMEAMIAMIIAALGILGILGVQMRTLTDTQTTVRRAQAIRIIEDLGERMKVNPNALASIEDYLSDFSDTPTVVDCSSGCSRSDQAKYDLAVWKENIKNTLPMGSASVFIPPADGAVTSGTGRQLGVMISWRENERDTSNAYKNEIDATQVRSEADKTLSAGGGSAATCPADTSCHLQYIPVPGRCAPYFSSGGSPVQYFCAGS